jgi:transposase
MASELHYLADYLRIELHYFLFGAISSGDTDGNLVDKEITKQAEERFGATARLSQCAAKQAKEIVRSQNKKSKRKRRMPGFTNKTANLDSRFVIIDPFDGSFDMCLKFGSGVPKVIIPFNLTKHTNRFMDNGWVLSLSGSIRLGYSRKGLFIDLIFEKDSPPLREEGKTIGMDRGFNTMLVTSDNQFIGKGLKDTI